MHARICWRNKQHAVWLSGLKESTGKSIEKAAFYQEENVQGNPIMGLCLNFRKILIQEESNRRILYEKIYSQNLMELANNKIKVQNNKIEV